jgi:UPF0755 protein
MFMEKKFLNKIFFTILFLLFICFSSIGLFVFYINKPITLNETTIIIDKGSSIKKSAEKLKQNQIINNKYIFRLLFLLDGNKSIRSGEYSFKKGMSLVRVYDTIKQGKIVIHKINFPEGYSNQQIYDKINSISILTGEIDYIYAEGSLLPSTYYYSYGDRRQTLVKQMYSNMQEILDQEWENRFDNLPYKNKYEALIMASIIEKETNLASERSRIAAVFINRMKKKMKLQADPTVIYALTEGKFLLNRKLLRSDLTYPSPYNTYYVQGLPPHPIANPGKEAIKAALNPLLTDELYFVTDGNGGHNFAKNLSTHNINVQNYKKKIKNR